jgi:hypothetical protein
MVSPAAMLGAIMLAKHRGRFATRLIARAGAVS